MLHNFAYWLEVFFGSGDRNGKFEFLAHITYEGKKYVAPYTLSYSWCDPQPSKLTVQIAGITKVKTICLQNVIAC